MTNIFNFCFFFNGMWVSVIDNNLESKGKFISVNGKKASERAFLISFPLPLTKLHFIHQKLRSSAVPFAHKSGDFIFILRPDIFGRRLHVLLHNVCRDFFFGKSCLVFAFFSANLFSRPATKDWKEKSVLCYFFYDTRQNKNFWFKTRFKSRHWRIPLRFMTNSFRTAHCCVGNQWPQWFLNLPTINLSVGGKQLGRQL